MRPTSSIARILLLLLVGALTALPGCTTGAPVAPGPESPDSTVEVVFREDFDGPALDRSVWNVEGPDFWVNNEQQAYIDHPSVLRIVTGDSAAGADGGALLIQAQPQALVIAAGRDVDFVSGRIDSRGKVEFMYGTAEARMKLPAGPGLWPAFWILGTEDWPATGEIDVMEYVGEEEWISHALHGPGYSGDTPLVARYSFPPDEDATGWHVYAVDWTPDSLVFRVDGVPTYRVDRAAVEQYGRWAFDNRKFLILNLALGGVYPQAINGVDAPYPGLPGATVDRIEAGEAKVLVDWVRVTRHPGAGTR
jgi:beta-glucanase (GH16 family)